MVLFEILYYSILVSCMGPPCQTISLWEGGGWKRQTPDHKHTSKHGSCNCFGLPRSHKVVARSSSKTKPKAEGTTAQIILHPWSNCVKPTVHAWEPWCVGFWVWLLRRMFRVEGCGIPGIMAGSKLQLCYIVFRNMSSMVEL